MKTKDTRQETHAIALVTLLLYIACYVATVTIAIFKS